MASKYLSSTSFGAGLSSLQSQILEATLNPRMDPNDWVASPQMFRSFYNFKSNIYTVVSKGKKSVLPSNIFPRSCSTQELIKIFQSKGYAVVPGGKGSHVKLKNQSGETMILPGNRREISKGLLSSVLKTVGLSIYDLNSI
jgi:predicted RNA binding protein YcfA (HicA-like mRNA interferase family)